MTHSPRGRGAAAVSTRASAEPPRSPRLPAWLDVALRAVAALLGGYVLAATATAFLSLALPMARSQAVLTAMLTGIALYACAALWAFATRSALRAWLGIGVPASLLALGTQWLQGMPA